MTIDFNEPSPAPSQTVSPPLTPLVMPCFQQPAACAAPAKADLSKMHACMQCRASKTSCQDARPCKRCV